ncbi:outer membrane beta-barrel protein [Carboxylicivirga sp. RSCT41]|uniref:outer membrane beta-barrel protein n=1 Tax=Carboxylicivirga agarovorans TaxID=3417570 RepID=UPI003D3352B5
MFRYLFLVFLLLLPVAVIAQGLGIKGVVIDSGEQLPLPGATVLLTNVSDSLVQEGTITSMTGEFDLSAARGKYALQISFMGYKPFRDTLLIEGEPLALGTITLWEEAALLDEIQVVSQLAPTFQKGDTVLFNPEAFKVSMDATANDLLLKMPGFFEIDGKLMAMGDTIKEVLVDGKRFFGNNVQEALTRISPEMIEEVEVYQYKSDEAKYSGFEDMNGGQTVNIVTRAKKEHLMMGELAAGLGKDERYVGEANFNRYSEKNRLNINGGINNVSAPIKINRGRGQNAISGNEMESKMLGANYGIMGDNDLNVRYNLSDNENENYSTNSREYVAGALQGQANQAESRTQSKSANQMAGIDWSNQANEKFQLRTSVNAGKTSSESRSLTNSSTYMNGKLLNENLRVNSNEVDKNMLGGRINFIRRLNEKGSAISANVNMNVFQNEGDGSLRSETQNEAGEMVQSVDQRSNNNKTNTAYGYGLSYNHALSKKSHLNFGYNYSQRDGESVRKSFNYDEQSGDYTALDTLTSSEFNNASKVHKGKLAFKTGERKSNLYLGINISQTTLESAEVFPETENLKEHFLFFEPQVKYSHETRKKLSMQASYGMSNRNPSLRDLQDIVDNSNPLYISTGNPNLKSSQTHQVSFSIRKSNPVKGTFTSIALRARVTNNKVAQNRVVAQNDTTVLGDYFLPAGGQFSQAVNLDGYYRVSLDGTFSLPFKKLKSKLNMRTGLSYNRTPTIINNVVNHSNRLNMTQNFTLSSNISEKIDFKIVSNSHFSMVDGQSGSASQSNYFTQSSSINLYYNFYKKFIFKTNTNHTYTGASGNLASNSRLYLNLALSTKVFKNNKGEIILTAYDLANHENEINRQVDEFSVSESFSPTLNQFYMLSFVYKI